MKLNHVFFVLALIPTLLTANDSMPVEVSYNYSPNCYQGTPSCSADYSCYAPECSNDCCSGFSFYGDWLYWRARRSNLDYALPWGGSGQQITASGRVLKVEPDYQSGFRLGFIKEDIFCDLDFEVRYTHFAPSFTDSFSSPSEGYAGTHISDVNQNIAAGEVAFANAKWAVAYDQVDLILGRSLCSSSCFTSKLFGGFTWARLDQTFLVNYYNLNPGFDFVQFEHDMDAYGLNLGVSGSFAIFNCLDLFGSFWYNALMCNMNRKFGYQSGDAESLISDLKDDAWEMVSVLNFSVGLAYSRSLCWSFLKELQIAIGYELHHWLDMPYFLEVNGPDQQMVLDRRVNFDFDGLFVRVGLGF